MRRLAQAHWARHGGLARREGGRDKVWMAFVLFVCGMVRGHDRFETNPTRLNHPNKPHRRRHQVLLHAWAEAKGGEGLQYLNPASHRVVTVDHQTGVRRRCRCRLDGWVLDPALVFAFHPQIHTKTPFTQYTHVLGGGRGGGRAGAVGGGGAGGRSTGSGRSRGALRGGAVRHGGGAFLAWRLAAPFDATHSQSFPPLSPSLHQATSAVFAGEGGAGPAASSSLSFRVAIYAEKLNLRNFWAASWLSLWEVTPEEEGGDGKAKMRISGRVKVRQGGLKGT